MEELLWHVWPWLALVIFAVLVRVILRVLVQLLRPTLVGPYCKYGLSQGNAGVGKLLLLSLVLSGIVIFLIWAAAR